MTFESTALKRISLVGVVDLPHLPDARDKNPMRGVGEWIGPLSRAWQGREFRAYELDEIELGRKAAAHLADGWVPEFTMTYVKDPFTKKLMFLRFTYRDGRELIHRKF